MGFSVVGASGVIFVALMIAVSGVFIQLSNTIQNLSEESEARYERAVDQGLTNFLIRYSLYDRFNESLILELENTGSKVLDTREILILVGGVLISTDNVSCTVSGNNGNFWPPGEHLTLYLNISRLEYNPHHMERVGSKVQFGFPVPESLATNGHYTYIVDDGSILIYDYRDNYLRKVSEGLTRARYVSATRENIYVVDNHESIIRYDRNGDNLTTLITSGLDMVSPRAVRVTEHLETNHIYVLDDNLHVSRFDMDGIYIDTPISGLNASDIYVTDHIYITNQTSNNVDRYDLDGTNFTVVINSLELTLPTNITVSDRYIFVIDNRQHVDVFTLNGTFVDSIKSEMSDVLAGIDVAGGIQVGNGANGWFRLNLGLRIKVVVENGISGYITI